MTPNLRLPHIYPNQGQKEVTANQFADGLDVAIAGHLCIELKDGAQYSLTTRQARQAMLTFTGTLTAAVTILIPTEHANKKFIIAHACQGNVPIHLQHPNTPPVTLQPQERRWIYSNGEMLSTLQTAPRLKRVAFENPLLLDCSNADRIWVELTGDTQIELAQALSGQTVTVILQQDAVGNHQITWAQNVRFSSDIPPRNLNPEPKKHDKVTFVFNDDGEHYYDLISWLGAFE